jgi:hypothetical protein
MMDKSKLNNMLFKLFRNKKIHKHTEAFKEHEQDDTQATHITVEKLLSGILKHTGDVDVGADVYTDIEMFENYRDIPGAITVFDSINKTHTLGGALWLKDVLKYPVAEAGVLSSRQKDLKEFEATYQKSTNQVSTLLSTLQDSEKDVLWFFSASDEELRYLYEIVYFQSYFLFPLNKSNFALTAYNIYRIIISPLTGILSPIIYFIVPYLVLVFKYNVSIGFIEYLKFTIHSLVLGSDILTHLNGGFGVIKYLSMLSTAIFYFQNIFNSFDLSSLLWKVTTKIYSRTNKVFEFLQSSHQLLNIFKVSPTATPPPEISNKWFLLDNFGRQLSFFKNTPREQLIDILKGVYEIDFKASIMSLLDSGFCISKYIATEANPKLSCHGLWHPSILNAVPNDIINLKNTIITGPNAGGKSTLLKAILCNIVLSQTIGVAAAKQFVFTPFKVIGSQISIPDCKGKESLFQAEMFRCKEKLDLVKTLSPQNSFMFIAMDEIFNSTNPLEGIAGAYAVLKKLAEYPNVITMITTHFLYLTKLKHHGYDCKRMNVVKNTNGTFHFPYKLQKGISRQHVALELLAENGFDSDLLETALEVKTRIEGST